MRCPSGTLKQQSPDSTTSHASNSAFPCSVMRADSLRATWWRQNTLSATPQATPALTTATLLSLRRPQRLLNTRRPPPPPVAALSVSPPAPGGEVVRYSLRASFSAQLSSKNKPSRLSKLVGAHSGGGRARGGAVASRAAACMCPRGAVAVTSRDPSTWRPSTWAAATSSTTSDLAAREPPRTFWPITSQRGPSAGWNRKMKPGPEARYSSTSPTSGTDEKPQ
mmetsp:Transcript_12132/g.36460  ORF Transcript_12132/g.36460 Transcript_12132/m.36460 type:complete len:223 (+) Transcript_12132:965-1633(+)